MLEGTQEDNVSNIHRRWSFTQLSPSSFKQSFIGSVICGVLLIAVIHVYYLRSDASVLVLHLAFGAGVLALLHLADYLGLRRTPVNKHSKVAHVALFANFLWLLTALLGIAADYVFSKGGSSLDYIVAGTFLVAGLRVGIFTSVFGATLARAVLISFIMPLAFLFVVVPASFHSSLFSSYYGAAFGVAIYALGVIWVVVTDRAGRPIVPSTFGLLQAFLSAWTEKDPTRMEQFIEARAQDETVATSAIKFSQSSSGYFAGAIVLPDIHPGPFGTVGGSNLPFVLYQHYSNKALVMHGVSDHSLNIPSKHEVERYLNGISRMQDIHHGDACTKPSQVKEGRSTATGIAFGRTAVVMLSLAPYGMEDLPQSVKTELEGHGKEIGFSSVLVIDCHNAMGRQLSLEDRNSLVSSAKQCLNELNKQPQQEFRIGFSDLVDVGISLPSGELGQAGIAVMALSVGDKHYAIGWADSNNMQNNLRDQILAKASDGPTILEVCTSDTHSTSGKRTKEGYFALGDIGGVDRIASAFEAVSKKALERASDSCTFEYGTTSTQVKVMGEKQFEDYSKALDSSMRVTKIFLGVTAAVYIAMLVVS
jgi:putative membrane protein